MMNLFDFSFWQSFLANLLATVVGVAIGIPVAFWINRRVEANIEKEKTAKIFDSLVAELGENLTLLVRWNEHGEYNWQLTTIGAKMSDEIWNAFSDGGELEWIKEPWVLGELAAAYAEVKLIKYLSDKYLNFETMPTSTAKVVLDDLTSAISTAKKRIPHTIAFVKDYRELGYILLREDQVKQI